MSHDENFVFRIIFDEFNIESEIPIILFLKDFNFFIFWLSLLDLIFLLFDWVQTHGHENVV